MRDYADLAGCFVDIERKPSAHGTAVGDQVVDRLKAPTVSCPATGHHTTYDAGVRSQSPSRSTWGARQIVQWWDRQHWVVQMTLWFATVAIGMLLVGALLVAWTLAHWVDMG